MHIKNGNDNNIETNTEVSSSQKRQYLLTQRTVKHQSTKQMNCVSKQTQKFQATEHSYSKRFYKTNRKFKHSESEKAIKTHSTVVQNHLNELMDL